MATYYGEILPLSSRAVDDEEDTDIPVDQIELVESNSVETRIKEPEFLFFAVVKKRRSETSVDDVPFTGLDYRRKDDILARVFSASHNPKALVCLCPGHLEQEIAGRLIKLVFGSFNCSLIKTVASMSSAHITEFKTPNPVGSIRTPLLRHLSTSSLPEEKRPPSAVSKWLEQPNILSGIAAAALTECEIQTIAGVSFVCYVDASDSTAARAFQPFLKCWPLDATASSTENTTPTMDRLILERLSDHGNLYI